MEHAKSLNEVLRKQGLFSYLFKKNSIKCQCCGLILPNMPDIIFIIISVRNAGQGRAVF